MKVWQKYILKKYVTSVIFIFMCVTGIFIIVDLMVHIRTFAHNPSPFLWGAYYLANIFKRLDLLVPFSILLSTIRALSNFHERGELVALLTSGISKQTLLKPILYTALIATGILYLNYEFTLPWAHRTIEAIEENNFGKKKALQETPQEFLLNDGTKLIFASYDKEKKCLHNVFWIISVNKIYYMKELYLGPPVVGKWVDHIIRDKNNGLKKVSSFPEFTMKHCTITEKLLNENIVHPNQKSLSQLGLDTFFVFRSSSTRAAEIKTYLLFKMIMPWLTFLAFVAIAPFCMTFSKHLPILFIYLLSLAALFTANIVLNAAVILGKFQIASPLIVFAIPTIAVAYFSSRRYSQL